MHSYPELTKRMIPIGGVVDRQGKQLTSKFLLVAEVPSKTPSYLKLVPQVVACDASGNPLYTSQMKIEVVITE